MQRLLAFFFVITFLLILLTITAFGPEMMEIFRTCSLISKNQSGYYEALARNPLQQKHKFYLYNITNGNQLLNFDDTPEVDEVGPFTYDGVDFNQTVVQDGHMWSLSLEDLQFRLNESVADESAFLYTLNIQLIRNLSSESFLVSWRKDLVQKVTVRDVLREIVDGNSLGIDSFPEIDGEKGRNRGKSRFKELTDDVSSSYLKYLRNEICFRAFRVVRFVNPPTYTLGRLFQKSPCECLTITPNGTAGLSRKHPEYPDVHTTKYRFQWNDELCAGNPNDPFLPPQQNQSFTGNLFWMSSPAYWRNKSSIRYRSVVDSSRETSIVVEPMSDVVTDFFFEYQLNLPVRFVDRRFSEDVVYIYPVLLTVTSGVLVEKVEFSILEYILFPKETVVSFMKFLGVLSGLYFIFASILLFIMVSSMLRQQVEPQQN